MEEFLDRVALKIQKGLREASSRSKDFIEMTRLKAELRDLNHTLADEFVALGQSTYKRLSGSELAIQDDGLRSQLESISALLHQAASLEARLHALEAPPPALASPVCPQCGQQASVGDSFCLACGTRLATSMPSAKAAGRSLCSACGTTQRPGAKFCLQCGTRLTG
jgi:hypothetical protein